MFPNDDQEMNRIYQESLHPKDYSQDGAYSDMDNKKSTFKNAFKQDVHGNVNRYSANKYAKVPTYDESKKAIISAVTIVGIIILTLVFILLPMIIAN